jgi:hypothetical protein
MNIHPFLRIFCLIVFASGQEIGRVPLLQQKESAILKCSTRELALPQAMVSVFLAALTLNRVESSSTAAESPARKRGRPNLGEHRPRERLQNCRAQDCTRRPFYTDPQRPDCVIDYCGLHAPNGYVNAFSRRCRAEGCPRVPSFGDPDDGVRAYCMRHKAVRNPFTRSAVYAAPCKLLRCCV